MLAAGVPITLNADDQLWFSAGITDQYAIARDVWGLGDDAITAFGRAGALATGMSTATRERLLSGIDAWLKTGEAA
jgi:adenosine deaminase